MRMAAQYELLKELLNSGTKLSFGQEFFYKFYQAFILKDRWMQYVQGVGTTLLVTAIALALGVVLGSVVALVRVAHDQQRSDRRNPVLGFFNAICQVYTTIIRGTPMMVQLLIMSMVIFANSRNFTMVGALALGINSGAYVSEIIRGGLMAVDPGQMEAGRSLGLNYITTMVVIIIPQAIRAVLPALGNEFIVLLKDTSLITVIGGKELLYAAQGIMNRTYEAMFPLFGVALIYLVLVIAIVMAWYFSRTRSGLCLRAVGEDPGTADAAGINVTRYKYLATCLGGGICGLGGLYFTMVSAGGNWSSGAMDGKGWLAVALVIFALWKPLRAVWGSVLFGALVIMYMRVTQLGSPTEIYKILPSVVTVIVLISISIRQKRESQPPASLGNAYFREER